MAEEAGAELPSMTGNIEAPTPQVALAGVDSVANYVKRVVTALLEDDSVVHPTLERLLSEENSIEKLRKFISDTQVKSLLIQRTSVKG